MKKIGTVILVLAFALMISGCAKKEKNITCKMTTSGVDITYKVGFVGNKLKTMAFTYSLDLSDYNDEQLKLISAQDYCEIVKEAMPTYKDAFSGCTYGLKGKTMLVSTDLIVEKIASNERDTMGSPEETRKALEKTDYSCTYDE